VKALDHRVRMMVEGVLDQHLPQLRDVVVETGEIRTIPAVDQDFLRRPAHAADQ